MAPDGSLIIYHEYFCMAPVKTTGMPRTNLCAHGVCEGAGKTPSSCRPLTIRLTPCMMKKPHTHPPPVPRPHPPHTSTRKTLPKNHPLTPPEKPLQRTPSYITKKSLPAENTPSHSINNFSSMKKTFPVQRTPPGRLKIHQLRYFAIPFRDPPTHTSPSEHVATPNIPKNNIIRYIKTALIRYKKNVPGLRHLLYRVQNTLFSIIC